MKTKEELKQLAIDVVEGRVFGTWMVRSEDEIGMVFMTLLLMGKNSAEDMRKREVVHLYEYLSKAGPRSVNGLPCFFSHHELTKQEAEELQPLIDKLRKMREEFANA